MLGSVMSVLIVATLAYAGVGLLMRGKVLFGTALFGVAVAVILVERYVMTPSDLPILAASKAAEAVIEPPDEE